jgi:hypothetical protein
MSRISIPVIDTFTAGELQRMREKIDSVNGPNVKNEPRKITIGMQAIPPPRPPAPAVGLFLVKVKKTGGSDGNLTTAATWTYDVYFADSASLVSGERIDTGIAVYPPRPKGLRDFAADGDYAWAFRAPDKTLYLWLTTEVEHAGGC